MKTHLKNHRKGFTLVELMVAMAITTVMVTILISITSMALDSWNRSRAEVRAARQAQAMTEIMARDFEAMVTRSGNNFEWLVASAGDRVGTGSSQSPNSADLIFFTAATDRYDGAIGSSTDLGGDISAVGYSLRYKDPMSDTGGTGAPFPTFVLYRKLVNPDETFQNLLGQEDLKTAFSSYQADLDNMSNFVCENIHQFSVTFHVEYNQLDSTGLPRGATPRVMKRSRPFTLVQGESTEIRLRGDGMEAVPANSDIGVNSRITAVELSITVLTDNAVDSIRNNQNVPEAFIARNSFQYSKRVEIPRM